jgi:2-C-methyl-D-erythritol 2,4-cyclodiphosphate synthase
MFRTGLGICSHRFLPEDSAKPCVIGGVIFNELPGFQGSADGDVIFYALCHAITSLTGVEVIGTIASTLYVRDGITDSEVYLREALKTLQEQTIVHIALSLEAKRPFFKEYVPQIRNNLSQILSLKPEQIGISAISGDGLSDVACGGGVRCTAIITTA